MLSKYFIVFIIVSYFLVTLAGQSICRASLILEGQFVEQGEKLVSEKPVEMTVRIYDDEFAGELLFEEKQIVTVGPEKSVFTFEHGKIISKQRTLDLNPETLWIEVESIGQVMTPRLKLADIGTVNELAGSTLRLTDVSLRTGETATLLIDEHGVTLGNLLNMGSESIRLGTVLRNTWPNEGGNNSGGITGIIAGMGLDGGGTLGDVTLNLANPLDFVGDLTVTGNLGVGVKNPNKKLYILDKVAGLTFPLKIENEAAGDSSGESNVGILFSAGGSGSNNRGKGALVYETTKTWNRGCFHFLQDNGANSSNPDMGDSVMTITNNGYVGVGTSTPEVKMEVVGDVRVDGAGNGFVFPDGTKQTSAVTSSGFGLPLSESSTAADKTLFSIENVDGRGGVSGKVSNQNKAIDGYGVSGHAYCVYADAYGLFGTATGGINKTSYGVYGEVSSIVPNQKISGYGVFGKNVDWHTWGYVGGELAGAQGTYKIGATSSNYGQLGTSIYGVYGYNVSGNKGYIGGNDYAVYAESWHGTSLYAIAKGDGDAAIHAVAAGGGYAGIFEGPVRIVGGSDLSEPFHIKAPDCDAQLEEGMVVSIDPQRPGHLTVSISAYDHKVAGIISGAGGIHTGMVMGQPGTIADGTNPVALSGRVYCLADAQFGVIVPGDLLTTSTTPGYAMRVMDHQKAQGAILGKAMTYLKKGKGLVLVLVSLQ